MKLPGKKNKNYQNGQENEISFKQIKQLVDENILLNPPYQTDIDEDKVNEMIKSYLENPSYLIFKNRIIVGVVGRMIKS